MEIESRLYDKFISWPINQLETKYEKAQLHCFTQLTNGPKQPEQRVRHWARPFMRNTRLKMSSTSMSPDIRIGSQSHTIALVIPLQGAELGKSKFCNRYFKNIWEKYKYRKSWKRFSQEKIAEYLIKIFCHFILLGFAGTWKKSN